MMVKKNNGRNGIGTLGEGTAKGAQALPTPYTTKVAKSRPEIAVLVEAFKAEAKLYQALVRKNPERNVYQLHMAKVMGVWNNLMRMAYWTTGSGKKAYEVMGNELYAQIKHGLVWDDYDATEDGASNTFTDEKEQQAASIMKVYNQAKAMGIRNVNLYSADELSLMMQEKATYKVIDRLEREYDKELLRNPKIGTIRAAGRKRRQAEEFTFSMGRAMDKIRDGKATPEYTQSILGYVIKTMEASRLVVLNWSKKGLEPRLQKKVNKVKQGHSKMHLVLVANNLLDMLQEIGLYKNLQMLQEYNAAKAGKKHKASSWVKKEESVTDVLAGAVEYRDLTASDEASAQEQLEVFEEESDDSVF